MKLDRSHILFQIQQLKSGKKISFGQVSSVHNRIKCNYLIMFEGNYIEETIDPEVTVTLDYRPQPRLVLFNGGDDDDNKG